MVVRGETGTETVYRVGQTQCRHCKMPMSQEFSGDDVILECYSRECEHFGIKYRLINPTADVVVHSIGIEASYRP
jgi:hypothetical protein